MDQCSVASLARLVYDDRAFGPVDFLARWLSR